MFIGVTFPVSAPSTATFAPEGNEVTFSEPFCALALPGVSKSAADNTTIPKIL